MCADSGRYRDSTATPFRPRFSLIAWRVLCNRLSHGRKLSATPFRSKVTAGASIAAGVSGERRPGAQERTAAAIRSASSRVRLWQTSTRVR